MLFDCKTDFAHRERDLVKDENIVSRMTINEI